MSSPTLQDSNNFSGLEALEAQGTATVTPPPTIVVDPSLPVDPSSPPPLVIGKRRIEEITPDESGLLAPLPAEPNPKRVRFANPDPTPPSQGYPQFATPEADQGPISPGVTAAQGNGEGNLGNIETEDLVDDHEELFAHMDYDSSDWPQSNEAEGFFTNNFEAGFHEGTGEEMDNEDESDEMGSEGGQAVEVEDDAVEDGSLEEEGVETEEEESIGDDACTDHDGADADVEETARGDAGGSVDGVAVEDDTSVVEEMAGDPTRHQEEFAFYMAKGDVFGGGDEEGGGRDRGGDVDLDADAPEDDMGDGGGDRWDEGGMEDEDIEGGGCDEDENMGDNEDMEDGNIGIKEDAEDEDMGDNEGAEDEDTRDNEDLEENMDDDEDAEDEGMGYDEDLGDSGGVNDQDAHDNEDEEDMDDDEDAEDEGVNDDEFMTDEDMGYDENVGDNKDADDEDTCEDEDEDMGYGEDEEEEGMGYDENVGDNKDADDEDTCEDEDEDMGYGEDEEEEGMGYDEGEEDGSIGYDEDDEDEDMGYNGDDGIGINEDEEDEDMGYDGDGIGEDDEDEEDESMGYDEDDEDKGMGYDEDAGEDVNSDVSKDDEDNLWDKAEKEEEAADNDARDRGEEVDGNTDASAAEDGWVGVEDDSFGTMEDVEMEDVEMEGGDIEPNSEVVDSETGAGDMESDGINKMGGGDDHFDIPDLNPRNHDFGKGRANVEESDSEAEDEISDDNTEILESTSAHQNPRYRSSEFHRLSPKDFDIRHNHPAHLQLKREVRHLAAELLDLPESSLKVPTPAQLMLFHRTLKEQDGPSLDNLRLDLGSNGLASQWNKRAGLLFARRFIASQHYACKSRPAVVKAFANHLASLRQQYQISVMAERATVDPDAADEAAMRKRLDKSLKARRNRRRSLRHRRKEACLAYSNDPSMGRFLPVWSSLPLEAMSGDESSTETKPPVYAITTLPWRNPSSDVINWMRTFDKLHLSTRFSTDDRPTPGQFPHRRIVSRRIEAHNTPPKGLPLNFYDPVWLQTLDSFETEALDIQPPIDLTFSPRITYIAARFATVKNRHTPPLARNDSTLPPCPANPPPGHPPKSHKRRTQGRK